MNAKVQTKSAPSHAFSSAPGALLQRKCNCGGGAAGLSGDCEECAKKRLQRKATGMEMTDTIPPIVHEVLRSSGDPLEPATRGLMESRFGHDFSRVRTHRDSRAGESARAVNALAYTVGQDVVFGAGQYAPETVSGRKLLAHELAHVVQQRNATYPMGGLTLADSMWEREADAAAEAAVAGQPAHVARHTAGTQLARQQLYTETLTAPQDAAGRKVEVTRAVKAGKCAEVPETRTDSNSEITRTRAAIELSYCRGRTSASAKGEIDYSDVTNTIRQAVNSAPNFLSNPNQQALSDLEQAFKRVAPRANVRFDVQVGGTKVEVTGSGTASVEGGVSGKGGATVSGRIGKTGVEGGVEVSGGTDEETRVVVTGKITPGGGAREIPNCFKCVCADPTITFACVIHPSETPGKPPPSPKPMLYEPLFFEYEKTVPRKGSEGNYGMTLDRVIGHLREGYTIARIEGGTSPEGPLERGRKKGFEGNISLAQSRAEEAHKDLQVALSKAIGKEELKFRNADTIRRLKAAQSASYDVKGLAPGGHTSSAELFGTGAQGEVSERDMLKHLKETLKKPKEGERDPLAETHVIGEGLPADVRKEVEAEVEVFREGQRGGKKLKDRELLETIYKPLRRALIVLNPPAAKPFLVGKQLPREELEKVV
ncbi:MAG TPA: DUF4157 domain-containing protein, partial [Pyrinomonadaceae bacterium]|nr:DUF4157 domain-containing protein [Pyrinomonadaceae bacterium]